MKATGPSILTVRFDPEKVRLGVDRSDSIAYHFSRLIRGEETADSEWEHNGLEARLEPQSEDTAASQD